MITKRDVRDWNRQTWERKNRAMYDAYGENRWPWFNVALDPDIDEYLRAHHLPARDVLDIGVCSGAQTLELARRGHRVTGTEISETALERAQRAAAAEPALAVRFLIDDIAESGLEDDRFDLVIDRGCYHSICSFNHEEYVATIRRVLRPGGAFLLKVMSSDETRFSTHEEIGGRRLQTPFHFTVEQLQALFSPHFVIEQLRDSFFHSSVLDAPARARLVILRNGK